MISSLPPAPPPPSAPQAPPDDHYKDSCGYSVEIAKQFLTLASAGLAFVVALAIGSQGPSVGGFYTAVIALCVSILCGLLYLMTVVGHINKERNYDVYGLQFKVVALSQIVAFVVAVGALAYLVRLKVGGHGVSQETRLVVSANGKTYECVLPAQHDVSMAVLPSGEIRVEAKK